MFYCLCVCVSTVSYIGYLHFFLKSNLIFSRVVWIYESNLQVESTDPNFRIWVESWVWESCEWVWNVVVAWERHIIDTFTNNYFDSFQKYELNLRVESTDSNFRIWVESWVWESCEWVWNVKVAWERHVIDTFTNN
jgi:hypothetical protein